MDAKSSFLIDTLGNFAPIILFGIFGVGFISAGIYYYFRFKRKDEVAWIADRAPFLSLSELQPGDDAWVHAKLDARSSITLPHFGIQCVYYSYYKHVETEDSEGNTSYHLVSQKTNSIPFRIIDKHTSFEVRSEETYQLHTRGLTDHKGEYRYKAEYLEKGSKIHVLGVVSDDGKSIGAGGNVPLIITTLSPLEFSKETAQRMRGHLFVSFSTLFWGTTLLLPFLAVKLGLIPENPNHDTLVRTFIISACLALVPIFTLYAVTVYNQLIAMCERLTNAWRLIDIDLKHRHEVVPDLVQLVKEFSEYEKSLYERLVSLRNLQESEWTAEREKQFATLTHQVIALKEKYPELTSKEQFKLLVAQLKTLEEKIAYDRSFYNDNVAQFNATLVKFPDMFIAKALGLTKMPFLKD